MHLKVLTLSLLLCFPALQGIAQQEEKKEEKEVAMEISGQIMLDMGYDFGRMNPDWFDVMRPTQLLDENGNKYQPRGVFFMGVRQSRLGVKNYLNTSLGKLQTQFEFELFGVGENTGQTTFRLTHAWAQLGKFGAGQTYSPFMDIDVFPNTIEYWGPSGMPFFRNIQVYYRPIENENQRFTVALERPGAVADEGIYGEGFEYAYILDDVSFKMTLPDLSAEYRHGTKWGYVELAGILRNIQWEDNNNDQYELSGRTIGWGLNLSTNIRLNSNITFRGSVTGGAGIQNYMDDADADLGVKRLYNNSTKPIDGVAIPMLGLVAFTDINWSKKFSSSFGYSSTNNQTTETQLSTAFKKGRYAVGNILYYPVENCFVGLELQWASRQNNDFKGDTIFNLPAAEGNYADNLKIQLSVKYKFGHTFYRK